MSREKYSDFFRLIFVFTFLIWALAACSESPINPLVSDNLSAPGCPEGGCASSLSDPTMTGVRISQANFNVPATQTKLDVSGTCLTSTFDFHAIRLRVRDSYGVDMPVTILPVSESMVSPFTNLTSLKCDNGKFDAIVNVGGLSDKSKKYEVVADLSFWNSGDTKVQTNSNTGTFVVNLSFFTPTQ